MLYHIVVVYATHRHESATGTRVSPDPESPLPTPSSPQPSGLSQSTGFECPASRVRLALVICFTYSITVGFRDCQTPGILKLISRVV